MDENEQAEILDTFISLLTSQTGIIPLATHRKSILNYITKRSEEFASETGKSAKPENIYRLYMSRLLSDERELDALICESTVNETYFFREQPQYEFLKKEIFPKWKLENPGRQINIWSAASSTGEEAYSLALLARSCSLNPKITATDIDTIVLEKCRTGVYDKKRSMKTIDGSQFHNLLEPFLADDKIKFSDEIKSLVTARKMNLKGLENDPTLPTAVDIIFLRNVFIYFSPELRKSILQTITNRCLRTGGYIFVSMSEVASIGTELLPQNLVKEHVGTVFYLRKTN